MAVEYTDETHVDPNKHYTTAEIAKMIREKKYGKDVRESIALFVESFDEVNGKLGSTLAKVEQLQKNLIETQSKLKTIKKELETENKELNSKIEKLNSDKVGNTDFDAKLSEFNEDWKARLKRVTLGTDEETIENVVTKILIEKGVI